MKRNLPNKIEYSFLKIFKGADLSSRKLPIMVAESKNPGPVVWLTGCIHGDEVAGMVVIQEIFRRLKREPLLKGIIKALPLVNYSGFEAGARNITATKEDINRSFPGNKDGYLAERVAERVFGIITKTEPIVVLDLHNDWVNSIPYALVDPFSVFKNKEVLSKTLEFAKSSGLLVINDQESPTSIAEAKTTLSGSLAQYGIPSITMELGGSNLVNEKNVEDGVAAVWNILSNLKMVVGRDGILNYQPPKDVLGRALYHSEGTLSSKSGIIRFLIKPGEIVNKDQPVARVYNAFGKLMETIDAPAKGVVLGHADYSLSFPGLMIATFGVLQS